nr:YlxR family protein [Mitsuokella multacida]
MMKIKKIPQRMCLGCQESRPKKEMVRIVRSPEGEFSVDFTGKKPGRGAYICHKRECFDKAKKSHGLERSFKSPIDAAVYDLLERELFEDKIEG